MAFISLKASQGGTFKGEASLAWQAPEKVLDPMVMTTGDIDGDGDADLWLSQYKLPYVKGQMPTPIYDANDGFPGYLLLNDGTGRLTDSHRRRRAGSQAPPPVVQRVVRGHRRRPRPGPGRRQRLRRCGSLPQRRHGPVHGRDRPARRRIVTASAWRTPSPTTMPTAEWIC